MDDRHPRRLREIAMRHRRTSALVSDEEMRQALIELADELEVTAEQLEKQDRAADKC